MRRCAGARGGVSLFSRMSTRGRVTTERNVCRRKCVWSLLTGIETILREMDEDGDGVITVKEFYKIIRRHSHLMAPAFDLWDKMQAWSGPCTKMMRELRAAGNERKLMELAREHQTNRAIDAELDRMNRPEPRGKVARRKEGRREHKTESPAGAGTKHRAPRRSGSRDDENDVGRHRNGGDHERRAREKERGARKSGTAEPIIPDVVYYQDLVDGAASGDPHAFASPQQQQAARHARNSSERRRDQQMQPEAESPAAIPGQPQLTPEELELQAFLDGPDGFDDDAHAAATRVQAAVRGHTSRKELRRQRDAVTKIQSAHRGRAVRKDLERQHEAATKVQAVVRGNSARKIHGKRGGRRSTSRMAP